VELAVRGSRPGERRAGAPLRMLRDYAGFVRQVAARRVRVVHQNTSFGGGGLLRDSVLLLSAKLFGKKVVLFWHGWDARTDAGMRGVRLRLFRAVYFRADACVVLAQAFAERLRGWGYTGPIHVETTLVDDAFAAGALSRPAPGAEMVLLFLARVERPKGIFETIDAVGRLREQGRSVRLVVAGDGADLEAARARAAERGVPAEFLGHVQGAAKRRAFAAADAYILPSYGEGMPTSLLEAMACGLPVVTRPVGGLRDFFRDGEMGFCTESLDPADLAGLIARLADDPALRRRMGEYNRAFAADRFLASRVVARLESVYRSLHP
jgi:glycosyltransferase involved in cell wall biosynthesis